MIFIDKNNSEIEMKVEIFGNDVIHKSNILSTF